MKKSEEMEGMTFQEAILNNELFLISSHIGPDGDNVSSSLALKALLKNMGKEAYYVLDDSLPKNLEFLYRSDPKNESYEMDGIIGGRDYVFIGVDCGVLDRFKLDASLIGNSLLKINIDHHKANENFGDINIVNEEISSTCELIYTLIKDDFEEFIDSRVATCLYTGMLTDSGNFMYESANSDTLKHAAQLLEKGAEKSKIVNEVFRSDEFLYLKLTGEVLSHLQREGRFAYAYLTKELREKWGVPYNDIESLVNYTINVSGVELGILFKEKEKGEIKLSLRSKGDIDVAEFASRFGGGGHKNAAGCTIKEPLEVVLEKVIKSAKEYIA